MRTPSTLQRRSPHGSQWGRDTELREHRVRQLERHVELGIRPDEEGYVFDSPDGSVLDPNELAASSIDSS